MPRLRPLLRLAWRLPRRLHRFLAKPGILAVAAWAGIAPVAPAIGGEGESVGSGEAYARMLFHSDLENLDGGCFSRRPDAGCDGWMGIHDSSISIGRGEKAHSGRQALKIDFKRNEDFGGAWRAVKTRHLFARFYDYYDRNFDFAAGMKILRISSFNEAKQVNDFDIILQLKADEPGSNNCGLTDAKYLDLSCNGSHPVDWGSLEIRWTPMRGRWYAIETEVKLNTPGHSDGELRLWIDGRQVAEKTRMNLTDTVSSPINRVMFGGWYSNSAAGKNPCPNPATESIRYVDDPVLSTTYIGPMRGMLASEQSGPSESPGSLPAATPAPASGNAKAHKANRYNPIPD